MCIRNHKLFILRQQLYLVTSNSHYMGFEGNCITCINSVDQNVLHRIKRPVRTDPILTPNILQVHGWSLNPVCVQTSGNLRHCNALGCPLENFLHHPGRFGVYYNCVFLLPFPVPIGDRSVDVFSIQLFHIDSAFDFPRYILAVKLID